MIDLPVFPEFRCIELKDKPLFDKYFCQNPPVISEFTFTYFYVWRNIGEHKVSQLNENIIVSAADIETKNNYYIFILGKNKFEDTLHTCIKFCKSKWGVTEFYAVDEQFLPVLLKYCPGCKYRLDRNNFDYVYNTNDLIELKGKKYDGKRNHISNFKKKYNYTYSRIRPDDVNNCARLLEEWQRKRKVDNHSVSFNTEIESVKETLNNIQVLGLKCGAILIDDKVQAFTIGEELNPETAVIHIEKYNPEFTGISAMINQLFATEWKKYKYINREQDMGDLGLRKSKESYHPAFLVQKYCVTIE